MTTAFLPGFLLGLSLIVAIGAQNLFVLRQGIRRQHVLAVAAICAASDAVLILVGVSGIGFALQSVPWVLEVARWAGALFLLCYAFLAARRAWRPSGDTLAADLDAADAARRPDASAVTAHGARTSSAPAGEVRTSAAPAGDVRVGGAPAGDVRVGGAPAGNFDARGVRAGAAGAAGAAATGASATGTDAMPTGTDEGTAASTRARTPLLTVVLTCLALTWLNPHVYLDTVFLLGSVAATHGEARWWFAAGAVCASAVWFLSLAYGARHIGRWLATPRAWRILDGIIAVVMVAIAVSLLLG